MFSYVNQNTSGHRWKLCCKNVCKQDYKLQTPKRRVRKRQLKENLAQAISTIQFSKLCLEVFPRSPKGFFQVPMGNVTNISNFTFLNPKVLGNSLTSALQLFLSFFQPGQGCSLTTTPTCLHLPPDYLHTDTLNSMWLTSNTPQNSHFFWLLLL